MKVLAKLIFTFILMFLCLEAKAVAECGPCQQVVINKRGGRKCVRKAQCCEDRAAELFCLINPCLGFKSACARARHCVPAFCEDIGCRAYYYDEFYNPISNGECKVKVLKIGDDNGVPLDGTGFLIRK